MKRASIGVALLFGLLGSLQLLSAAGAASSPQRATTSITFKEGLCGDAGAHCKWTPKGSGESYGTRLLFKIPLSTRGTKIGYEEGECVFLNRASKSYFCVYDLHLADGTVSVQGTLPYSGDASGTIPVSGGTDAYLGAYGTLTLRVGYPARYTLEIVTP
jgi:hypothetical protein